MEWHETKTSHLLEHYRHNVLMRLKRHAFPKIGKMPISHLEIPDILGVVNPMELEEHTTTAKYVLQNIGQIFRYAVLTGRAKHNIAADLQGALPSVQTKHHASITDKAKVDELLRRIDEYDGYFPQKCV